MGFVYTVPVGFWLGLLAVSLAAMFTSFFYKNKKYPSAQVFRKYTCTNGYFIKIIWLQ